MQIPLCWSTSQVAPSRLIILIGMQASWYFCLSSKTLYPQFLANCHPFCFYLFMHYLFTVLEGKFIRRVVYTDCFQLLSSHAFLNPLYSGSFPYCFRKKRSVLMSWMTSLLLDPMVSSLSSLYLTYYQHCTFNQHRLPSPQSIFLTWHSFAPLTSLSQAFVGSTSAARPHKVGAR